MALDSNHLRRGGSNLDTSPKRQRVNGLHGRSPIHSLALRARIEARRRGPVFIPRTTKETARTNPFSTRPDLNAETPEFRANKPNFAVAQRRTNPIAGTSRGDVEGPSGRMNLPGFRAIEANRLTASKALDDKGLQRIQIASRRDERTQSPSPTGRVPGPRRRDERGRFPREQTQSAEVVELDRAPLFHTDSTWSAAACRRLTRRERTQSPPGERLMVGSLNSNGLTAQEVHRIVKPKAARTERVDRDEVTRVRVTDSAATS